MRELEEIKRTPVPITCTYDGKLEQSLVNRDIYSSATNIETKEEINQVKELSFILPFNKDRLLDYGSNEKRIYFDDIIYIIKEMVFDDANMTIKVSCEEICTTLKLIKCENICEIGKTPKQIFEAIVTASKMDIGYKWLGTDVPDTIFRHLQTESETSCYENLIQLASVFNGNIEFSYNEQGQGYVFLRSKSIKTGKFFKKGVDLKSLSVTYDSKDLCSKIYATGYTDDNGITLDIQSVNGGNSLLCDYSYFRSLGIPEDILLSEPQYNGIKEFNDDKYVDANDLLQAAKEELAKCCRPKITAEVSISDLSQIVGSPVEKLMIGMDIQLINKELEYIFDCFITGIERNYTNPLDTKLTISNDIPYRTYIQDTSKAIDTVGQITTTDPRDSNGNIVGDGSPCVIASKCVDSDHINIVYRNAENKSLITETATTISLKVEEIDKSYSELKLTADEISSTVSEQGVAISEISQKADSITTKVSDLKDGIDSTYSSIEQTAYKIKAVIESPDGGSSYELSKDAFKVAFKNITNDITQIDGEGILVSNENGTFTRIGSKGLEHVDGSTRTPYHYLTWVGACTVCCHDYDYTSKEIDIPSKFDGIDPDNITVLSVIKKIYDSNDGRYVSAYWSGAYASIQGDKVVIEAISTWRNHTTGDVYTNGLIDVGIILIA